MVSQSLVRSFQRSFIQMNKSVAANTGRSQLRRFSKYMIGMTVLYTSGIYGMYATYYQSNKIKSIFSNERAEYGAEAHHSM